MRKINYIILHDSKTDYGNKDYFMHLNGFKEKYHYIITNQCYTYEDLKSKKINKEKIEQLYNDNMVLESTSYEVDKTAIHIGIVGNFLSYQPTVGQLRLLINLLSDLMIKYNIHINKIIGHYEVPYLFNEFKNIMCPGIFLNIRAIRRYLSQQKEVDKWNGLKNKQVKLRNI